MNDGGEEDAPARGTDTPPLGKVGRDRAGKRDPAHQGMNGQPKRGGSPGKSRQ